MRSAPTMRAERSGTSSQPGRDGDVAVGLDDDGAQRLVRDAAAVALRVAAFVLGVADRAVGDALDVQIAHRVRAAGGDEAAAVGRGQRELQRRRPCRHQQAIDERQAVSKRGVHGRGSRRRLVQDAGVVQEREEQVEEMFAR